MAKVCIEYSHEEISTFISKYLLDGGVLHQYSVSEPDLDLPARSRLSKANRDDLKARKKYLTGKLGD